MAILLSKAMQSMLGGNQREEWIIRDLDRILKVKVFLGDFVLWVSGRMLSESLPPSTTEIPLSTV